MNFSSWFLTRIRVNRIKRLRAKVDYHEARAKAYKEIWDSGHSFTRIGDGYVRNQSLAAKYKAMLREEEGN